MSEPPAGAAATGPLAGQVEFPETRDTIGAYSRLNEAQISALSRALLA